MKMSNKTSTIEVVTKVNEGCAVLVADEGASRACRSLSFSNIQYSVSVKAAKGEWVAKPILRNVSGSLRGGEMMCVLGPSGSGKTSLVQIVAGGIKSTKSGTHTVCGRILVDGEELTPTAFRRISGFVTQEDVFEGCLTVEETIFFKAALILADMTASERRDRLEAVIAALQLQSCRATYIGDDANPYMKGISGGEKRRLAIAIEILDPSKSVLLADEPTSGLDAASAQAVVNLLRRFADEGMTVLASLHQPRSSIMTQFDSMMVLAQGRAVYYGSVADYTSYLSSALMLEVPLHDSPYDLLLDVMNPAISAGTVNHHRILALRKGGDGDASDVMADILAERMGWADGVASPPLQLAAVEGAGGSLSLLRWMHVTLVLTHRTAVIKLRDPICLMTQVSSAILMGVIFGALYIRVYDKSSLSFALLDAQMCNVMTVLMAVWLPYDVTLTFPKERRIFLRERKAGLYTTSAFFVARVSADMPSHIISAVFMAIIVWAMAGLNISLGAFILVICYSILIGAAVMQLIGAVARTFEEANIYMMVVMMFSMMLGSGFVREAPSFLKWARDISIMGIAADIANYLEFRNAPAKYGPAHTIYSDYGILITSDAEMWAGVLVLFYIYLIARLLCYLAVKFCYTGRTLAEDWRD